MRNAHFLAAVFVIFSVSQATMAEPPAGRTIDMTVVLLDQNSKPIPDQSQATVADPRCEKCAPLTLGAAVAFALLSDHRDERPIPDALEKARRGALALSLLDNKSATLSADKTAKIIKLMDIWGPIVIVRAVPLLDPDALKGE